MNAIVQDRYGAPEQVLRLKDVDRPAVGDDDVLVRVRATSVNTPDWITVTGVPYVLRLQSGVRQPRTPVRGTDVAGVVEAVGENVTDLRAGDEVFGSSWTNALTTSGTFAELAVVPASQLIKKPVGLSFEEAAASVMSGITALIAMRDVGRAGPGTQVLINGASGGVGTFAVQIAKALGADVTGVSSTRNVQMVRSLGADHVIDYTQEDFTRGGERYDLIFQLAGTESPSACRRALKPKGTLLLSSGESEGRWIGPLGRVLKALLLSPFVSQSLASFTVKPNMEDLQVLTQLIEDGTVTPVIDRTYSLSEVPEAIRYLEEEH